MKENRGLEQEKTMAGKLYGVGVGPGDPELLTIKALRIIKKADVIAVPGDDPRNSAAYKIVRRVWKGMEEKCILGIPMPMTKETGSLEISHHAGAVRIQEELEKGNNVAFLTLGDPTVYSTYLYIHKRIAKKYEAEIINGIPSFCAAASRLNIGLVEQAEPLHIIPASYPMEDALELSGTKVLMKAGKQFEKVKRQLLEKAEVQCMMVEKCGMAGEQIHRDLREIPENAGYYSLIIVKEKP